MTYKKIFSPTEYDNKLLKKIKKAIRKNKIIKISYVDGKGVCSKRIILPKEVLYRGNILINAYCFLRKEERHFRLDRIKSAKKPKMKLPKVKSFDLVNNYQLELCFDNGEIELIDLIEYINLYPKPKT